MSCAGEGRAGREGLGKGGGWAARGSQAGAAARPPPPFLATPPAAGRSPSPHPAARTPTLGGGEGGHIGACEEARAPRRLRRCTAAAAPPGQSYGPTEVGADGGLREVALEVGLEERHELRATGAGAERAAAEAAQRQPHCAVPVCCVTSIQGVSCRTHRAHELKGHHGCVRGRAGEARGSDWPDDAQPRQQQRATGSSAYHASCCASRAGCTRRRAACTGRSRSCGSEGGPGLQAWPWP